MLIAYICEQNLTNAIKHQNNQDPNKWKMWQKLKDINENLCVVSLGPVVARPALTKDKVVWTVDLAHRSL